MKYLTHIIIVVIIIVIAIFVIDGRKAVDLPQGETLVVADIQERDEAVSTIKNISDDERDVKEESKIALEVESVIMKNEISKRELLTTDGVLHSIPIDEIKQGCFGRDCIPSVDDPQFIDISKANKLLPEDTIGIGLEYKGEERFYPFNMLVTKEIVNDVVAGDPLVVTYCPLCGTGIVFDRTIGGEVMEFGVSGMLWQSNLLMYNRNDSEEEISLWSQVLGEAVLGKHTSTVLTVIPSDVVLYTDWRKSHTNSVVLDTGRIGDPYGGNYYAVAQNFNPDFDESKSELAPMTQVLGIQIEGTYKAYVKEEISIGETHDTVNGKELLITKNDTGQIRIVDTETGENISIVTGFWFSWVAVHPETELLIGN